MVLKSGRVKFVRNITGLILVAEWLEHIIAIHRGLHRDGDIKEIIPDPWHHKQNLKIFMFKLCLQVALLILIVHYTTTDVNIILFGGDLGKFEVIFFFYCSW